MWQPVNNVKLPADGSSMRFLRPRFSPVGDILSLLAQRKYPRLFTLKDDAPNEAFLLRSAAIVRVLALKMKSRHILCLICG
jgi:hypothetical protein